MSVVQQPMQPMAQTHLRTGTDNLPVRNRVARTPTVTVTVRMSRLLNYVFARYLIVVALVGLFGA